MSVMSSASRPLGRRTAAALFFVDHLLVGVLLALCATAPQFLRGSSPGNELVAVSGLLVLSLVAVAFYRFDRYRDNLVLGVCGDDALLHDRKVPVDTLQRVKPAGTLVGMRLVDSQGVFYYAPLRWRIPISGNAMN